LEYELHVTNGARESQSGAVYMDKCWQLGPYRKFVAWFGF